VRDKQPWKGPPEILDLLRSIDLGEVVWAHDIVTKITGLRSVAGDLYLDEVKLEGLPLQLSKDNGRPLTIDQLLLRYPPFEPIQVSFEGIIGKFVWFVDPQNAIIPSNVPMNAMVNMDTESGKLLSVRPMDLLSKSSKCHEVIVKVRSRGGRGVVFIKYGSEKLYNEIIACKDLKVIQEDYENYLRKFNRKAYYSVTNLGYAWYCILGRGLSTDPYDLHCPFMKECAVGRTRRDQKRDCKRWSWSRKLFPKVFVTSEREIAPSSLTNLDRGKAFTFITPFAAKGVRVHELYRGAQWYMPSVILEGPVVEVIFKKPIRKSLPLTNVVGFEVPLSVVRAAVESLLDEGNLHKPEVIVIYPAKKVSLDKLLLSKYYVYRATKGGLDSISFLERSSQEIVYSFKKFCRRVREGRLREKLINFLVNVAGHTLAHLFFVYISNALEIEPDNLLYVFKVDKEKDFLLVAVAENSTWGSLDIVEHAKSKFGSLHDMVRRFVSDAISALEAHERELVTFLGRRGVQVNAKLSAIADEVKRRYGVLVNNGVVLDAITFLNHIILSEEDRGMAEKLKGVVQNVRELREWLMDSIPVSGINTCVDGCTACIMLERDCIAPLLQNIVLSRNLTVWILKVLSGKEIVKGRGNVVGYAIFNQAKRKLFAFSPYVDEEGVKLLTGLTQRGVKVTLITYESCASKYREQLKGSGIKLYALKVPRHDKYYVIDQQVLVRTSQNLSNFTSINDFSLESVDSKEAEEIEERELKGDGVVPY